MPVRPRSLKPGDCFRVRGDLPLLPVDDTLDFLRVHYDTRSPGLARVVGLSDDGVLVELWGHRYLTPEPLDSPRLRPLGWFARTLAPERLGEWLLRREVRLGRVETGQGGRATGLVVRHWLRRTRGRLPILKALGGRIRAPAQRRTKAFLLRLLSALRLLPASPGFLDRGTLVDGIGVAIDIGYGGRQRRLWLDRILLHKNHHVHLVGIDLDAGEQRSFRLDRIFGIGIAGLGKVDWRDLYWELEALCSSREVWLVTWNRRQAARGRPPAPPIGRIGRWMARAAKFPARMRAVGRRCAAWLHRSRVLWLKLSGWISGFFVSWRLPPPRRRSSRDLTPMARPHPPHPLPMEMPAWRRRLLRAIATVEAGGTDQITALLPLNALLADGVRCRAYLRHLLALTLEEARADPWGHYMAPQLLAEALSLDPRPDLPLSRRRRIAARALHRQLEALQPGTRRVSIHAFRRRGRDSRLLLCEEYLSAVFGVGYLYETEEDTAEAQWDQWIVPVPREYFFYRTNAHFIARWDDGRYRVDATSAPKLRAIIAWWDAALATPEAR